MKIVKALIVFILSLLFWGIISTLLSFLFFSFAPSYWFRVPCEWLEASDEMRCALFMSFCTALAVSVCMTICISLITAIRYYKRQNGLHGHQ